MINQVILVGKINEIIEKEENKVIIILAIHRNCKNDNGEYETDFIECILNDNIYKKAKEYIKLFDTIGIKGKFATIKVEENDKIKNEIKVIVEKITFLRGE